MVHRRFSISWLLHSRLGLLALVAALFLLASGFIWSWVFGTLGVFLAAFGSISVALISRRMAAIVFAILLLLLGGACFTRAIHAYLQAKATETWFNTRGKLIEGRYTYRVGGTAYVGGVDFRDFLWTPFEVNRAVNQLRDDMRDDRIVVVYDPVDPSRSYLKVAGAGTAIPLVVGIVSLLIAIALIAYARRLGRAAVIQRTAA